MVGGGVLLVAFVLYQRALTARLNGQPLIELDLFKSRSFTWGTVLATTITFAMFGVLFAIPQFFQAVDGTNSLGTGLRLLPLVGGMLLGSRTADRITAKAGPKALVAAGFLIIAVGLFVGTTTSVGTGYGTIAIWYTIIGVGVGFGLALPTSMGAALSALSPERSGVGSAPIQALRQVGGTIGVAILGTVISNGYRSRLDLHGIPGVAANAVRDSAASGVSVARKLASTSLLDSVRIAFTHALDLMLAVGGGIAIAGILVAVTASAIAKRRRRYEARGLAGMADHRTGKPVIPLGRADPAVAEAMRQAIAEAEQESSRTATYLFWRTGQILEAAHGRRSSGAAVPAQSLPAVRHAVARTARHRVGLAPAGRWPAGRRACSGRCAAAPGEIVQIDSTPLDVLVLLDDGVPGRVELTGMIDVATRVVPAAVLRPTTKSADASVLLARALTPEPVRPGWPEALKMAHSALPYDRLLDIDARLEHAAARPVIVPDTIVIDHGTVFISAAFRSACRHLGISVQPAHLGSGAEKGHIERYFGSVGSLFCQFASGYAGRSADRRGRHVEDQPLWSMAELQELLDEWLVGFFLNRPHDGLRDPEHPGRAFTPNEKYAALIEAAGYVPVPLSGDDYLELLPAEWRKVNAYGIKLARRSYDSEDLNPLRLQPSGISEHGDRWEIRHDPYDVSKIHVRGPDGWITVFWKHLDRVTAPVRRARLGPRPPQPRPRGHRGADRRRRRGTAAAARTPARRSRRNRR